MVSKKKFINVNVTIKGISPLLMCKFSEDDLNPHKVKNKNITPEEDAEKYAYRDEKGNLCIPSECIFAAIIDAGKFHKKGKNKITTMKSSLIPAGITIDVTNCSLHTKDFIVDSRSVVVPATGGRIMRHRPRLENWQTTFTLKVDTEEFSEADVRRFVEDAGSKCGLLAYRPNRKGSFGKFEIEKWELVK